MGLLESDKKNLSPTPGVVRNPTPPKNLQLRNPDCNRHKLGFLT